MRCDNFNYCRLFLKESLHGKKYDMRHWAAVCQSSYLTIVQDSLLPISEFVLDEKFHRNTSKFAIFYIGIRKPKVAFPFFISCYFVFPLMNALVYVDID